MPTSLADVISQDLIDRLIDTVDQHHLNSCALVCRSFLPRSQYHLFSSVKLNSERIHGFYDIVMRKPFIAEHVQTLHLVLDDGNSDLMIKDPKFLHIMTSITRPTTSLQKLKIEGEGYSGSSLQNPQLFLDRFFKPFVAPVINSLHIDTLGKVPLDVIDSCVKLTELTLVSTSFRVGRTHTNPPQHKIRKLGYHNSVRALKLLTDESRSRLDLSELRSLNVHTDSLTELKFEQWVINQSSGALEELYLKIFDEPQSHLQCFIDLKCSPNLRILDFDIHLGHPMDAKNEDDLDKICLILSTLPQSNRFDTLRLTAYVGYLWIVTDPNAILNANWARLQMQLAKLSSGKAFFEFAFGMTYLNSSDGEEAEEDDGGDMKDRCASAVDRVLTEKMDLLAKNPSISIINLGHYVDIPHESTYQINFEPVRKSEINRYQFPAYPPSLMSNETLISAPGFHEMLNRISDYVKVWKPGLSSFASFRQTHRGE